MLQYLLLASTDSSTDVKKSRGEDVVESSHAKCTSLFLFYLNVRCMRYPKRMGYLLRTSGLRQVVYFTPIRLLAPISRPLTFFTLYFTGFISNYRPPGVIEWPSAFWEFTEEIGAPYRICSHLHAPPNQLVIDRNSWKQFCLHMFEKRVHLGDGDVRDSNRRASVGRVYFHRMHRNRWRQINQ